ncbi:DNA-binding transcriptional regulator, MarR family [Amycolatopsis arida]|uniref:DNA-binding transcriptional regulator, MarR family n=1 Tax=Amycolatopsis arida TaxID=587909 RepID=A0A1I5TDH2_9PSEU|nr:helix-turn-helix domain-containing GNAT family N-acetyltransferase [Amycolatopsis arida]TDX96137.1 DNA-binding MarR family transcriptional regulator [Amycolatopsis arida]SFP81028.1 DNA-binding transcriptional regulator, MarR family [Amycolatopsis arida]
METRSERVARVRRFNRFYTELIGVLDEGLHGSRFSLTEARVLYELAQEGVREVADLRKRLDLDAGYTSRLLARLESRGLVVRERSDSDARRQVVTITDVGRVEQAVLERRAEEDFGDLLGRLPEDDQRRLLGAMDTITRLLDEPRRDAPLVLRPPRPGDLGWIVHRNGVRYAQEYGWGAPYEALVASVAADFLDNWDDPRQAGWIAELDGEPVGAVLCTRGSAPDTAKLRLLLVEPRARGRGVGRRLVEECVAFARGAGYAAIELWTNDVLTAARRIYQAVGFELVDREPHDRWGQGLVGETWRMRL